MPSFPYATIEECLRSLRIGESASDVARIVSDLDLSEDQVDALCRVLSEMRDRKERRSAEAMLHMSRLPMRAERTFESFDFSRLRGRDARRLEGLRTLSVLHAGRNIALIGPPGVGKTHLAMAFGYECCGNRIKTLFLKMSELGERLHRAILEGRTASLVNGLTGATCLIVDEVGRSLLGAEETRLFFDIVDRRQAKGGPGCMLFTSNLSPSEWGHSFADMGSALCAMDRIFDSAFVYFLSGESYRGRTTEAFRIGVGSAPEEGGIIESLMER